MEFRFPVNEVFKQPVVEIGPNLIPPGFSGDRRALWDTVSKVTEIVNAMGQASASAQGLTKSITTADRLRNSDQKLYLLVDQQAGNGRGAVTGMLKTGKKGLYVFDRDGQHYQVSPPCVLDFYVHESRQRNGLGKRLFEHMLQKEEVHPVKMAIDRPSEKFLGFLNKHYSLKEPVKQMNNYVVFDGFFPGNSPQQDKNSPIENNNVSVAGRKQPSNGLQAMNFASPLGRYGAPRPPCSMGQIIHNQTSTIAATPEPTGARSAPSTNYQQSSGYVSPENVQSAPNMYYRSPEHHTKGYQNQPQMSPGNQAGDYDQYQTNPFIHAASESKVNTQQSQMHQIGEVSQNKMQAPQTLQGPVHHSPQDNVQPGQDSPSQVWPGGVRTVKFEPPPSVIRSGLQPDGLLLQAQQSATAPSPQNHVNAAQNVEPSSQGQTIQNEASQQQTSTVMQAQMLQQQQQQQQQQQHNQSGTHMRQTEISSGTSLSSVQTPQMQIPENSPSARSGMQAPPVNHQAYQQNQFSQKPATKVWPGGLRTAKVEPPKSLTIPKRSGLRSPRSEAQISFDTKLVSHNPQNTQSAPQLDKSTLPNEQCVHYTASQPVTTQPRMQAEAQWPSTIPADQVGALHHPHKSHPSDKAQSQLATVHLQEHQAGTPFHLQQAGVQQSQSAAQYQAYQATPQQLHAQQASTQPHHLEGVQLQAHQTEIQSQQYLANAPPQTHPQAQLYPQESGTARSQPPNTQHFGSTQYQTRQTGIHQSQPYLVNPQHPTPIQPQQAGVRSAPNLASAHGEPGLHPQENSAAHKYSYHPGAIPTDQVNVRSQPNLAGVQAHQLAASNPLPVPIQPQAHQANAQDSNQPINVTIDPTQASSQFVANIQPQSHQTATQLAANAHQMGDQAQSVDLQQQQREQHSLAQQAEDAYTRQGQSANSQQVSQPETKQPSQNQTTAANVQYQQQMNQEARSVQQQQSVVQPAVVAHPEQYQSANSQQISQPETNQAYQNQTAAANAQYQQQTNQEARFVEPNQQYQQSVAQPALVGRPEQHQNTNPQQMSQPETNQAYQTEAANVQYQQQTNEEVGSVQLQQQTVLQPAVTARGGQHQSANPPQMSQPETNQASQNLTAAANVQYQQQVSQEAGAVEPPQQYQQSLVQPAVAARPGQHQNATSPQMSQLGTNQAPQSPTATTNVQYQQQMNQEVRSVEPHQQYQQSIAQPSAQPAIVAHPGQHQSAKPQQMSKPEAFQNPTAATNAHYQQQMNQAAQSVDPPQQYQQSIVVQPAVATTASPAQYQSASPQQMVQPGANQAYQNQTAAANARPVRSRPVVKTDGISDICSQRSKHRLYSNEQAQSAALSQQGRGDMKRYVEDQINELDYGYPPQRPQNFDNQAAPHAEFRIGSSPKLERPRSLSIQLSEEQADNKNGGVEVEGNEEVVEDDVEEELQKLAVEDNDVIPTKDINEAEKSPTTNKKTPSHLTEQGFFDLKFYHSKLW